MWLDEELWTVRWRGRPAWLCRAGVLGVALGFDPDWGLSAAEKANAEVRTVLAPPPPRHFQCHSRAPPFGSTCRFGVMELPWDLVQISLLPR